jgi:hypothetical protein
MIIYVEKERMGTGISFIHPFDELNKSSQL